MGGGGNDQAAARLAALHQRRRVVDRILGDTKKLRNALAPSERVALDQYVDALDGLDSRIQNQIDAPVPDVVAECSDRPAADMGAIAAQAIACGLTRVVTLFVKEENHSWWHSPLPPRSWHEGQAQAILSTWRTLESFGIADDTAIVWLSKNGAGHHRSSHQIRSFVIGDMGGAFGPGDRVVEFPQGSKGEADGTHIQRFHLTVAQAMAPSIESFAGAREPLNGLLA
ncbi:MAG: DUF1552 domain-containing protein, partial [Myxococcota bacterium]